MKWQRWHVVAGAAALLGAGVFIGKQASKPGPAPQAAEVAAPAARAPDDLLADIVVRSPNASWTRLQRGIGGAVGILPATLPGLLLALTDLETDLANEIDGTAPMYGVVAGDLADPAVVIAMRLVNPDRTRALLVDGETARFGQKDAFGMTVLVPQRPTSTRKLELALTKNGFLVATRRVADLERLAPYATRTLATRSGGTGAATIEVPRSALAGPMKASLSALWADAKAFLAKEDARMRTERGRAPDFGDPAAIVAAVDPIVTERIDVVGNLANVKIGIDVTDDALVLDATLEPDAAAGAAHRWLDAMKLGDASAVLALPAEAALAMSARDDEAAREEQSKAFEKAVSAALGQRLKDPAKIHDIVAAATKARDELAAFAITVGDPPGAILRAPVRDAAAAEKAITGVFDLAKTEPFKELLAVRDVGSSHEDLASLGRVSTLTLVRDVRDGQVGKKGAPKTDSTTGVAWLVADRVLTAGIGTAPIAELRTALKPERTLRDEPSLSRFVSAVGDGASSIVVLQPLRLDPKRAALPTAAFAFASGKRGPNGFFHVDIADGLFREAARAQMGF